MRVLKQDAEKEIDRLRKKGEFLNGFRIKHEGEFVLVPVRHSDEEGEFEESHSKKMRHVGSFESIGDFYVIKRRDGWEAIMDEILLKRKPRAVFIDEGVFGRERRRKLTRVAGEGEPEGIVKENGIRMKVNVEKAYFSPRLASIRSHLLENVLKYEHKLVLDMYAGVGPISLLLLKNNINTISIDVNPFAIDLLSYNLRLNRLKGNPIIADSNSIAHCISPNQVIMNNPTQDIGTSEEIVRRYGKGTVVHFFNLASKDFLIRWNFVDVLERREVHGFSPEDSLFYYLLRLI